MTLRSLCLSLAVLTTLSAQAEPPAAPAPALAPAAAAKPPVAETPDARNAPSMAFAADRGRISYAVGVEMARNFRKNEVDVDLDQVMQGMRDALDGKRPPMGEKELRRLLNHFQNVMRARTMTNTHFLAQENRKKGELFLAENRKQPEVKVLPNGVQYREIKPGFGMRATPRDIAVLNWRGTTLSGTEFDGSDPAQPMSIAVAELFSGFQSVVTQMQTGAHWQVWVPAALAYGERGAGSEIGPNETLVLDLELVGVRDRNAANP
jgi:FKBP-type peptidyl-prolyl cis-trans isomerase FklB